MYGIIVAYHLVFFVIRQASLHPNLCYEYVYSLEFKFMHDIVETILSHVYMLESQTFF